jgi:hypothetical protein
MALRRYGVSGLAINKKAGLAEHFYFNLLASTKIAATTRAYREAMKLYPGADIARLQIKVEA